jgi:hypothetical protein
MLKSILVAPDVETLDRSLSYIRTTLHYSIDDSFVCSNTEELKAIMRKLENCRVYLTHCFLIPWTPINLKFLVNMSTKKKVSVYLLDAKMLLTNDVYGKPIADVLSYLNLMKLYEKEFSLYNYD